LLEAVVSLEPNSEGPRKDLLDSARGQIRATVDEARQAVWNLRQEGSASPHVAQLLGQMAEQVSHGSGVRVKLEVTGAPVKLERAVEYVVLMVAREAVSNAVHHAQPREIQIGLHFDASSIQMQVVDDGRGFDPKEVAMAQGSHFGLIGMRERIEHVAGHFTVESAPGKGTRLAFQVPIDRTNGRVVILQGE
jgi:signal transduction histidine kinase